MEIKINEKSIRILMDRSEWQTGLERTAGIIKRGQFFPDLTVEELEERIFSSNWIKIEPGRFITNLPGCTGKITVGRMRANGIYMDLAKSSCTDEYAINGHDDLFGEWSQVTTLITNENGEVLDIFPGLHRTKIDEHYITYCSDGNDAHWVSDEEIDSLPDETIVHVCSCDMYER